MTKRSNTRPQAEQPADTLATQRERAARLRDAAGRFSRPVAEEPAPASKTLVEPVERPTPPGRVPAPRDTHPETYALGVADDSLGSHAARGASVIVEPVTPAGAGLAVVYLRGQGPRVFDLTHNFDPEHATPSAPGSDVEVLIEVALPETGRVGFLRADSVEKIHRVTGIYTPDAAMRGFRPAPPRLPVMRTCPEGMGTHRVEDAVAYPLVRPGETVVYDGMRRDPVHGALCVLQWNNGSRSVLLTNQRPLGNSGDDSWCVDPVNRPPSREAAERRIVAGPPGAMLYASDGPYSADLLREKIVGTVVGILVPDRASVPQDEAPAVVADPATETLPAGEQDADPIFATIERHIAARAACVGLDDREDEEGFEAAHDRATEALDAVESTQPTTVAGLLALARHMDRYLNEDAGGQNVVTPTAEGHAFVGLINACLGLADALDVDADAPLTVENAAPLAFEAYTFDDPVGSPAEWTDRFAPHSMGLCIADKTLRMTKPELVAFIRGAAERGNGTDEIMFKALNAAQDTLEGWGKLLSVAAARYLVAASAMTVEDDARQADQGGEA
ncbi:hypothetical protein Q8W71_30780 [Methylobacterium sp. NEAU 140]|uniref:hypothetical protein n=1 Tax=Methylobacterium sp. NEAU 140 TaxID=3064945 RepID=UPI00273520D8|nr:hypothetical protein [Methylobacterium sp. NEAU 140]MDP4026978.1 hypothetical protein [Methylobacterium sp. NEAU 140]